MTDDVLHPALTFQFLGVHGTRGADAVQRFQGLQRRTEAALFRRLLLCRALAFPGTAQAAGAFFIVHGDLLVYRCLHCLRNQYSIAPPF